MTIHLSLEDFNLVTFLYGGSSAFRYISDTLASSVMALDDWNTLYHIETDIAGNKVLWKKEEWLSYSSRSEKQKIKDPVLLMLTIKRDNCTNNIERDKMNKLIEAYKNGSV